MFRPIACKMRILNNTPSPLIWVPSNIYLIEIALIPDSSTFRCRFKDERVAAVIDGTPYHMARVYPTSEVWTMYTPYTPQVFLGFNVHFIARYRARGLWGVYKTYQLRYPPSGSIRINIVGPPEVNVDPTELFFYFDANVPITDKKTVLKNGTSSAVNVSSASIQPIPPDTDPNTPSPSGAGDENHFTLVSPTTFDFLVPPHGTQDFVVRFSGSTTQRVAQLVINTSPGRRVVRLSGKYFLK